MTQFNNRSFSVGSPGTEDYRKKHEAIFNCSDTGELKSKCQCEKCVDLKNNQQEK